MGGLYIENNSFAKIKSDIGTGVQEYISSILRIKSDQPQYLSNQIKAMNNI